MKTYEARFRGRQVGAIGIFYDIKTLVSAENEEQAERKIADSFERVSPIEFTELNKVEIILG